jgi:PKD repeat protein
MKKSFLKRFAVKFILLAALGLPQFASAQVFNYNGFGDMLAGFRKTLTFEGNYELVVDLGNITNLVKLSIGTTINITNFTSTQLTNAFVDTASAGTLGHLQWSVTATAADVPGSTTRNPLPWVTPVGSFPEGTIWVTRPSTSVTSQSPTPSRMVFDTAIEYQPDVEEIGNNAGLISSYLGAGTTNNTPYLVREPVSYNTLDLTAVIGDSANLALGDFGAGNNLPLPYVVENTTPSPFTAAAQRDDLYQLCPTGTTDPLNGSTTATYYLGYFLLNTNGTMSFTRALAAPAAGFSGTPTSGTAPLKVVFTSTSTGTVTNWAWNFGTGTGATNTTGINVTNTYAAAGTYSVTLTVIGPGGTNALTATNYITVSSGAASVPVVNIVSLTNGKFIFSGTNGTASQQFRVLSSTNIASSNWIPVYTNNFLSNGSFAYTNSSPTNQSKFFRLVSP